MAKQCGNCCNLQWNNKDSYSSTDKYYCRELKNYYSPNDNGCSYHLEDKSQRNNANTYQQSGCFLTTACLKHYCETFNDKCYELSILRWFRDNFVSKEDIIHYYEIAPLIINAIEENDEKDITYEFIYENIIKKCIYYIEDDEYDRAYATYKETVQILEDTILKESLEQRLVNTLVLRKTKLS